MRCRFLLAGALLFAFAGCVYVPPVTQGNYLKRDDLAQLKVGMTHKQVRFLFGTPMLSDPFYPDTWHYVYYFKRGAHAKPFIYRLTVQFKDDKVVSFNTSAPITAAPGTHTESKTTPAPPPSTFSRAKTGQSR